MPLTMTDHYDDETQFWDKPEWIRTGQTPRVQRDRTGGFERTRSHRIVRKDEAARVDPVPFQVVSFDDFAPEDDDVWDGVDHWVEPLEQTPRRGGYVGVDPVLLRIGAVGLVGVLMIPIALALRDDGGVISDQGAEVVTGTVAPALPADPTTTVVTVPITAAAPAPTVTTPAAAPSGASAARASQGIAAAPAAAAVPAEPECAGTYTVIANDFWNRFPRSSGATVQEWLNANNATADTPLYVGDELCIPEGATAPAPPPATTQPPTTTAAPTTQAPTTQAPTTTAPAPVVTPAPTTTRAPVAAAAPAAAPSPPAGATDPASVEALIREIWPDELEERALTIARRESGLNPNVHNYCCYGVFAIYFEMGRNFLPQMGVTSAEQLFDPRTNITAAYRLYTLAGWKPWVQTDPGS